MSRILISELYKNTIENGAKLEISGWVRTVRGSKAFGFMELSDGSGFKGVQVVFEEEKVDNFKELSKLGVGSAVNVLGTLLLTPEAKQPFEIHADKVEIAGLAPSDYPLQKIGRASCRERV